MNGSAEVASELAQRLRKVRALTESSVPGEAAAAAAKLQEILLKHNLEMEDIEDDSSSLDDRYVKESLELGESFGGMINWRRILDKRSSQVAHVRRVQLQGNAGHGDSGPET